MFICSLNTSFPPATQKNDHQFHVTGQAESRWPTLHHSSNIPARWWTGKDVLESIWSCISWEHFTGYNHAGHPHAKGSKANTFLETFRNASNAYFCHILLYCHWKKGTIMSKLPSLASAMLYREVQGSGIVKNKNQKCQDFGQWWVTSSEEQKKNRAGRLKSELRSPI